MLTAEEYDDLKAITWRLWAFLHDLDAVPDNLSVPENVRNEGLPQVVRLRQIAGDLKAIRESGISASINYDVLADKVVDRLMVRFPSLRFHGVVDGEEAL